MLLSPSLNQDIFSTSIRVGTALNRMNIYIKNILQLEMLTSFTVSDI